MNPLPNKFQLDAFGQMLVGTEIRAYVFEFQTALANAGGAINLISTNSVQVTEDGEIIGILADCWDAAATAALAFHVSFRLYNVNANVGITKNARQNPAANDFIRIRAWNQGSNQSAALCLFPGSKLKAMDELQVTVRLEQSAPAGLVGIVPHIVVICRENALARQER